MCRRGIQAHVCQRELGLFLATRCAFVFGLFALLVAVLRAECHRAAAVEHAAAAAAEARASAWRRSERRWRKGPGLVRDRELAAGAAAIFEAGYATYPYSRRSCSTPAFATKVLNDVDRALAKFKDYARVDPNAPDIDKVNQRIATLEAAGRCARRRSRRNAGRHGCRRGRRGAARAQAAARVLPSSDDQNSMKSLVVIETEPDGAPLRIYGRTDPNAQPVRWARPIPVGKRSSPRARLQASPWMSVTSTWSSRNSATSTPAKRTWTFRFGPRASAQNQSVPGPIHGLFAEYPPT